MKLLSRPYSNTWQTTLWVMLVVILSIGVSIWFFWRSLYLPELLNHARNLTTEINRIHAIKTELINDPQFAQWSMAHSNLEIVDDTNAFPTIEDKFFVDLFTDTLQTEITQKLGRDVIVYFKFKPTPTLWIQDSVFEGVWLREPLPNYAHYSTSSLIFFILGIPIITLITIFFLVRQLHRPLRKLQHAATNYIRQGSATTLPIHKGPIEIRQVNMAFNRLFTTLNQAQKERIIMLAGISHDLRTPLTRMRLTAEMLDDEFLREGLIYDIEDMDAILEQFISFMKDGSDEPVRLSDLNSIINEITVQFASTPFIFTPEPMDLVPIRPLSIKRLIINLVNNAIRYGEPPIYISAYIEDIEPDDSLFGLEEGDDDQASIIMHQDAEHSAQSRLVICVRDCGEGVPATQLKRILQPFERGELARTTQGSGLGLAIVKRIAELHHGSVSAVNHSKGGFEVCVRIPLITKQLSRLSDS